MNEAEKCRMCGQPGALAGGLCARCDAVTYDELDDDAGDLERHLEEQEADGQ